MNAPAINSITAAPIGALIPASHSAQETLEFLGESDGTPGQTFRFRHAPVLSSPTARRSRCAIPGSPSGAAGSSSSRSSRAARGTAISSSISRTAKSSSRQPFAPQTVAGARYGAVPPKGAALRFTRYRHGGGRRGNVVADTLTTLKSAIPGVASVTNPLPARGGVDQETLESTRRRAAMEIRTRYRAVTAEDFQFLAGEASPRVARVVCVPPERSGAVQVHILPRAEPANRKLELHELTPDEELLAEVAAYLDERRVIGTSVQLLPVKLRGLSVVVALQASPKSDLQRVEQDVAQALYMYVNPIVGGSPEGPGAGWEFGRALNQGELYSVVHSIEGVDFVKMLRVYETDLTTGEQEAEPAGAQIPLLLHELVASGTHSVRAERPEH